METINWNNINYDVLQEICNIYENINYIEDEKDKVQKIFLILYTNYNYNIEYIKEYIKIFYFLEYNEKMNIVEEVLESITIIRIDYIELQNNVNNIFNIITNIINNNVNTDDVVVSLNEEELNKIPSVKYSEISNECITCPICQDNIEQEHIVRNLKCNHYFHIECIDKYLLDYSYKCPTCRNECGKGNIKT